MKNKKTTVKARISAALVISIISAIVTIAGLAVNVYNARYNTRGTVTAKEITCEYSSARSASPVASVQFARGTLRYGYAQSKGNSNCKYTLSYRKSSWRNYKTLRSNYSCRYNNYYYGDYYFGSTRGYTTYYFMNTKVGGKNRASTLRLDLGVK